MENITVNFVLLTKICGRLTGMNYDDLTTAERQIVNLLIDDGWMTKNENGDIR